MSETLHSGEIETLRARVAELERKDASGQNRVLELLAKGADLAAVLTELVYTVEQKASGMLCSVLVLDSESGRLRHGAAPSLPEPYNAAVDGLAIGPSVGSCGTAAYLKERVVVRDVMTDPLWADFRPLAAAHGLRACWSQPVISSVGRVLGTFAMYYGEARGPQEDELEVIEEAANLAGIAIEQKRAAERALKRQEELAHVLRVATVGEMASVLAHELNQPFAAIVNNAEACARRLASSPTRATDLLPAIEEIIEQGERAGRIIHRIRNFVRKRSPQRAWVDLNDIINRTLHFVEPEVRAARVQVDHDLDASLPTVHVDPIQIEQVLMNLIRNAVEAVSSRDAMDRRLRVRTRRAADEGLEVCVWNSGPALTADVAASVFDPFFTTKAAGMGMGLAISQSIVEGHGGRLQVSSEESSGAAFSFVLPVSRGEAR